jgi:hypothetical protein
MMRFEAFGKLSGNLGCDFIVVIQEIAKVKTLGLFRKMLALASVLLKANIAISVDTKVGDTRDDRVERLALGALVAGVPPVQLAMAPRATILLLNHTG